MTKKTEAEEVSETQVLMTGELARWLRIPKSSLYKLSQEEQIPATKIGGRWRFDREIVSEWFRSRMGKGGTE